MSKVSFEQFFKSYYTQPLSDIYRDKRYEKFEEQDSEENIAYDSVQILKKTKT
jgi:hypothetical protein